MADKKSVLITDDDSAFVQALARRCAGLGLHVRTANDGLDTLVMVAKQPPDLLILDVDMPCVDGLTVAEKLIEDPRIPPLPVIVVTGQSDEQTLQRCKSLGAHYVFKDTQTWPKLEPMIGAIMDLGRGTPGQARAASAGGSQSDQGTSHTDGPTILVVDDDREITKAISIRLKARGFDVLRASNGMQGYWRTIKNLPDAIITDYTMPEGSGERFLIRLKENVVTKGIPVIVLTGKKFEGRADLALKREVVGRMGAVAYFSKPLDFNALLDELNRHIRMPLAS